MITTTVRHEDIEVVLRRETRGTGLKRSRYMRYVAESRDEFKQFATYKGYIQFAAMAVTEQTTVDEGTTFWTISDFARLLSQIVSTANWAIVVKNEAEYLPKDKVLEAFTLYENDETDLWQKLLDAMRELEESTTPVEQKPPELVKQAVKADPN